MIMAAAPKKCLDLDNITNPWEALRVKLVGVLRLLFMGYHGSYTTDGSVAGKPWVNIYLHHNGMLDGAITRVA